MTDTYRMTRVTVLLGLAALVAVPVTAHTLAPPTLLTCMQAAIEKRENALIAAVEARNAALKSVLTARRDALKAGWGITDRRERRAVLRRAWRVHRDARVTASRIFRQARRAVWEQFRKDARACLVSPGVEEGANEASDVSL